MAYVLGGTGVVLVAGGVVAHFLAVSAQSDREAHCKTIASPGLSPAYARTLISAASRGELAARIRSIVAGANGRTSVRRGSAALRTARAGFDWICPFSNAR